MPYDRLTRGVGVDRTELYGYLQDNSMLIESLSNGGRAICRRVTNLKRQHLEHPDDQGVLNSLVNAVSEFRAEMKSQEKRPGR